MHTSIIHSQNSANYVTWLRSDFPLLYQTKIENMTFTEILEERLEKDDILWRYIDLHTLLSFAHTRELNFTRLDKYSDPFEGVTMAYLKDRGVINLEITNPEIPEEVRAHQKKRKETEGPRIEKESLEKQQTQFASSWIRSNRESMAMWNIYSNADSVALKINGRALIDYLEKNLELNAHLMPKNKFLTGNISYFRLNPLDRFENPKLGPYSAFKKDVCYSFENEYRLLIVTPIGKAKENPERLGLPITKNLFELITVVYHPQMEPWKKANIANVCEVFGFKKPENAATEIRL